jgi:hypothetical protein
VSAGSKRSRKYTYTSFSPLDLSIHVVCLLHCLCILSQRSLCVVTHSFIPYSVFTKHIFLYILPTNSSFAKTVTSARSKHWRCVEPISRTHPSIPQATHSSNTPKRLVSDSLLLTSDSTTSTIFTFSITFSYSPAHIARNAVPQRSHRALRCYCSPGRAVRWE